MSDGGEDGPTEIVWACTECGRHHQKNSPPCKRCGNVTLEKRRPTYDDLETPGTSYLDVLEAKYVVGYLVVAGVLAVVALSMLGIVSVPWLGGPTPPGAPGDAEVYDGVSLESVEASYVGSVNQRRAAAGADTLAIGEGLDGAATAFNQRRVRAAVDGESMPELGTVLGRYEPNCAGPVLADVSRDRADAVFTDGDPDGAAAALGIRPADGAGLLSDEYDRIGVDVHIAPDGAVYATVLAC